MVIDVVMPKMGESITEGTILEWYKKVGEHIAADETLLEIGTDKVDSEIPAPNGGIVIEILAQPNDVIDVGEVIARIETNKTETDNVQNIEKPDDEMIYALILKNLSDKQILIEKKLINYIIKRIDRSYSKIYEFIYKIDELSLKKKKSIDLNIVKDALGE